VVSVLYQNGLGDINQMLIDIEHWMKRKNYKKIDDFRGLLNYKQAENPEIFERIQFMKYLSSLE
jgi:dihydroorotate dehydrogenase (fumarate)